MLEYRYFIQKYGKSAFGKAKGGTFLHIAKYLSFNIQVYPFCVILHKLELEIMLEWIKDNADWLFSGLAIFILSGIGPIIKYIKNKRGEAKRKKEQEETIKLQIRVFEVQLEDLRQKAMPSIEASGDVMANKVDRVVKMQLINNGNTAKLIGVDNLPAGWIEIPLTYPYL